MVSRGNRYNKAGLVANFAAILHLLYVWNSALRFGTRVIASCENGIKSETDE